MGRARAGPRQLSALPDDARRLEGVLHLSRRRAHTGVGDITPVTHRIVTEHAIGQGLLCPLLESHFSTLKPGAVIPPHCDLWNFSINLHLAVDIPPGCRIRVAHEERAWTEGKCLLFDYSFEHEA